MISEPAGRSYGENENLTLSDADLSAIGPTQTTVGGNKVRAYCPIHGSDHQRSLEVDLQSGRFHCHSCDCWGYMDWAREEYRRERGLERDEKAPSRRQGGSRQGRVRRPPVKRPPREAPKPPEPVREDLDSLVEKFAAALPGSWGERYLEHRCMPLELAREYGVGYAAPEEWPGRKWKGGRLVVPHTRPDGAVVNLYGRAVARGKVPKQQKHDHLAGNKGYWNARALREGSGPLYVAEGLLDALALIASGCERTVAIFSARDWRWHWLPSGMRQLVLAFDADDTGDDARGNLAAGARLRGIEVAYLDSDAYGGENDPAAAFATGKLDVGEWPEPAADIPGADPEGSTAALALEATAENSRKVVWDAAWAHDLRVQTMRYYSDYHPADTAGFEAAISEMDAAEEGADADAYLEAARRACREARRAAEAEAAEAKSSIQAASKEAAPFNVGAAPEEDSVATESVLEEPPPELTGRELSEDDAGDDSPAGDRSAGTKGALEASDADPLGFSEAAEDEILPEAEAAPSRTATTEEPAPEPRPSPSPEGDYLKPGRDHDVYLDGKNTATLLPSFYSTEVALQRAKHDFQAANPGRKVKVRRARRE